MDYITEIRIDKACELIKADKYKIYEVAEIVGYSSSQYFSQVFKRAKGITPQEYDERGAMP